MYFDTKCLMFNGTTFTALKTSEIGCPFAGNPFIRKKKKNTQKKHFKSKGQLVWKGLIG